MDYDYELGYTPKNLRLIRQKHNLTQQQVADITGTAHWRAVSKWEKEMGESSHIDMPYTKWAKLLDKINGKT